MPDNARREPRRILRGRHLSWRAANRASRRRLWLLVWVIPIKDPAGNHKGYPTPVARRHDGPLGADPLCAYDAFARVWWRMAGTGGPFPVDAGGAPADGWWLSTRSGTCLDAPIFTNPSRRQAQGRMVWSVDHRPPKTRASSISAWPWLLVSTRRRWEARRKGLHWRGWQGHHQAAWTLGLRYSGGISAGAPRGAAGPLSLAGRRGRRGSRVAL